MVANSSEKVDFVCLQFRTLLMLFQDLNETEESPKLLQFPLKIEWPSRKSFGFDDDDSDERPDSGVGESVSSLETVKFKL